MKKTSKILSIVGIVVLVARGTFAGVNVKSGMAGNQRVARNVGFSAPAANKLSLKLTVISASIKGTNLGLGRIAISGASLKAFPAALSAEKAAPVLGAVQGLQKEFSSYDSLAGVASKASQSLGAKVSTEQGVNAGKVTFDGARKSTLSDGIPAVPGQPDGKKSPVGSFLKAASAEKGKAIAAGDNISEPLSVNSYKHGIIMQATFLSFFGVLAGQETALAAFALTSYVRYLDTLGAIMKDQDGWRRDANLARFVILAPIRLTIEVLETTYTVLVEQARRTRDSALGRVIRGLGAGILVGFAGMFLLPFPFLGTAAMRAVEALQERWDSIEKMSWGYKTIAWSVVPVATAGALLSPPVAQSLGVLIGTILSVSMAIGFGGGFLEGLAEGYKNGLGSGLAKGFAGVWKAAFGKE